MRRKNQLTLPEPIADALGVEPGDRLILSLDGPNLVTLRKAPRSLAGAFPGVWGEQPEVAAHLRELRDEWDRGFG